MEKVQRDSFKLAGLKLENKTPMKTINQVQNAGIYGNIFWLLRKQYMGVRIYQSWKNRVFL